MITVILAQIYRGIHSYQSLSLHYIWLIFQVQAKWGKSFLFLLRHWLTLRFSLLTLWRKKGLFESCNKKKQDLLNKCLRICWEMATKQHSFMVKPLSRSQFLNQGLDVSEMGQGASSVSVDMGYDHCDYFRHSWGWFFHVLMGRFEFGCSRGHT